MISETFFSLDAIREKYINIYAGYFHVYTHIIYSVYSGQTNKQLQNTNTTKYYY